MGKIMVMSVFGVEVDRDEETKREREREGRSKKERKENLGESKREGNWRKTGRRKGKRGGGSLRASGVVGQRCGAFQG